MNYRLTRDKKWPYELVGPESAVVPIDTDAVCGWAVLKGRTLTVFAGYRWDGPSGPTLDTTDFIRPSLIHDALYQLMREGTLPRGYRKAADEVLYQLCRADGMSWFRAQYVYWGVRLFGGRYT